MFTFIIPSVNKGSLPYAVESMVNQTFPHWNAIICGDGTCIPTYEDDRILSMIAPHRGSASITRMYAAKYATEDWIVFLDDDDWVEPWYLEAFLPHLESDVIISQMNNYGNIMPSDLSIIHGQVGISFAVRREILLNNPFPPPPSEDYALLKDLEHKGYRIDRTMKCGYHVRRYLNE